MVDCTSPMTKHLLLVLTCLAFVPHIDAAGPEFKRVTASPILFEPNLGQTTPMALFVAQARGFRLLLEQDAVVFDFGHRHAAIEFGRNRGSVLGESPAQAVRNFRKGSDPRYWFDAIPTFEKVRYRDAFPGVDAVFYGNPGLEFDLALAAGADPRSIELHYSGFDSIKIESDGGIALQMAQGVIRQHLPVVIQDGRRIHARYVRRRRGTIGLEIANYDKARPLVIDPKISYATYLGGSGNETPSSLAVDSSGNYYLAAVTNSTGYPGLPASQAPAGDVDIVVSKFNANNSLVYTTLIGGSAAEAAYSAAADSDGNLYLSFATGSSNFPRPAGLSLGGIGTGIGALKLSPSGVLISVSTWAGAVNDPATGQVNNAAYGLALDSSRNVWITGTTLGFPGQAGAIQPGVGGGRDVFVARLNNALSQVTYFSYIGGAADENGNAIAVDPAGGVYISGNTGFGISGNAFLLKLDLSNNKVIYNKMLTAGGGGFGLVVDAADVWVCANSTGSGFTATQDAIQKAFGGGLTDAALFRLNAADGQIRYATYLGGSGNEFANALVQDIYGNLIVFGNSSSANFQVTADAVQKKPGNPSGSTTGFLAEVDPAGGLLYASYLGGSGTIDIGLAAGVDRLGNPIVAGSTTSTDFPVTAGAVQTRIAGGQDAYIGRVEFVSATDAYLPRIAIQNAASFRPGAVAPGEIITIYPSNAGPAQIVTATLTPDRHIATLLAGTRVLFDDNPAPIVYTVAGQMSVVVPYGVQKKPFTRLIVEYNGVKSRPITVPVADVAPGVFTIAGGAGQAVVLNQDSSVNSPGTPADRQSIIVFFATGEGQTLPPGEDGRLNEFQRLQDFPQPEATFSVTIGGQTAEILYAGGAPGYLAGLMQLNVRVPQGTQPSPAAPLVFTVGGVSSPASVTMAVR
ncbi:MAG: SBBP repeat-containing protein [Candidatus Solibacter sp.]